MYSCLREVKVWSRLTQTNVVVFFESRKYPDSVADRTFETTKNVMLMLGPTQWKISRSDYQNKAFIEVTGCN